jgi:multiple sugar transport system ATP-binding protein
LVAGEARKLVVGIRPEHLTVAEGGSVDREPTLAATVELVEALGNESLVHFSTDARTVRNRGGAWTADPVATQVSGDIASASAAEGVARVDPRVRVTVGERIALTVDVRRLHFFDAETGDAVGATGRAVVAARKEGNEIGNVHR